MAWRPYPRFSQSAALQPIFVEDNEMANHATTYEDVEKAANAIGAPRGTAASMQQKGAAVSMQQFCTYWPMIKGILQMVRLMLPKNVRDKIDQAIPVCDALCQGGGGGGGV
jgi:hypothetical protein